MNGLADLACVPCQGGEQPLGKPEIEELQQQLAGWDVIERDGILRLERVFKFKNFVQALRFANQVGEIAEVEGHHPALLIEWGKVTVTWWTHTAGGLHRNDFIMAARTNRLQLNG